MSVIAQYYYRQQAKVTPPAADKPAVSAAANPAPAAKAASTHSTAGASFQQALSASQKQQAESINAAGTTVRSEPARPKPAASTTPTLEQLVKFARSQGWSEKQIALMKRLSLRKNSRTGKPWSESGQPVLSTASRQVREQGLVAGKGDAGNIRGIRNNNPGNIEASELFEWQGQTGNDGRFATFSSPEHGIRALGMNLLSYHRRGLDTISKVISRWAPAQDNNDTSAYINKVSQALGVSPHERLDLTAPSVLSALSKAIIRHENGTIPFAESVISSGVFSALGLQNLPGVRQTAQRIAQPISGQSVFSLQASAMNPLELKALRQTLSKQLQAAKIVLQSGGEATNIPSKAELVAAWGYTEGSRRFEEVKMVSLSHSRKAGV
ncbi:hypothetical protein EHN07_05690 [Buttiauxella warmboldiae]|uniref:Lytic transglycosylase n=1 Tax=Buttiauxella warmboldiae TaxID=82993 RepID=A0A3N5DLE8_9ENTR|nr:hypothetical protein [Buttiauxella warmboldiae]RPH29428.1 hypothetical protein EHN07_05690 [Buttiauxella warmboldiae]